MHSPTFKYVERYSQGVIIRSHTLREYNAFLWNLGEKKSLTKLASEYVKRKGSCRILDVGCGNAEALREVKQHVGSVVHTMGIDLLPLNDSHMLDEFIQGDVHGVPFPSDCDIIVSFRALHEMDHFATLFPTIANALAPGGRAYLWIRMREENEGSVSFVGEMNAREEKYVQGLLSLPSDFHGCRILVEPVRMERGTHPYVGGYVVLLMRP